MYHIDIPTWWWYRPLWSFTYPISYRGFSIFFVNCNVEMANMLSAAWNGPQMEEKKVYDDEIASQINQGMRFF